MKDFTVSFSIVVYKQPLEELQQVVNSLLRYAGKKYIYIIDNSPEDNARVLTQMDKTIVYRYMGKNLGFGAAHNIALTFAEDDGAKYHFVVNPDISYSKDVVKDIVAFMEEHNEVGLVMPKILNEDGKKQFLPKLCPTPSNLFWRKMKHPTKIHERKMNEFEMREMRDDRIYDVPCVSGCFSVIRLSALREVGKYDERYFMYFEDTDLARRMHQRFRTVYFPFVSVHHGYGHGATKSPKLFLIFVTSAIKYFCKWGWFFDSECRRMNGDALKQLKD